MQLILASASPRRSDLLRQLGVEFSVDAADIDEQRLGGEKPADYVQRLAQEKAAAVAARHAGENVAVLAADTAVVLDEDILGKPGSPSEALGMLARLSGRSHTVMTGCCLVPPGGEGQVIVVETRVTFRTLDYATCKAYLATDEPWDKAGGYAIQGLAGAFVTTIEGSYSNVVGLPLAETWDMLADLGIATALEPASD
ncbi:Maf family protein [Haliea sp. E17]|uniref:Maf family protein n=1 Tax=Haliea sp. E17 TaxID=3401576 RepID=UPI003AAD8567